LFPAPWVLRFTLSAPSRREGGSASSARSRTAAPTSTPEHTGARFSNERLTALGRNVRLDLNDVARDLALVEAHGINPKQREDR
jgi:hypothetical protein